MGTASHTKAPVSTQGLWFHLSTPWLQCPNRGCEHSCPHPVPIVYIGTAIYTLYLDQARGNPGFQSHCQPWSLEVQNSIVAVEGKCLGRQGESWQLSAPPPTNGHSATILFSPVGDDKVPPKLEQVSFSIAWWPLLA